MSTSEGKISTSITIRQRKEGKEEERKREDERGLRGNQVARRDNKARGSEGLRGRRSEGQEVRMAGGK